MIGEVISHYRVLRQLGGGGMGIVYEAEDVDLGRHVALKFLPAELEKDPLALERFQAEARAASALNHANICTIYEIGKADNRLFIAMELLEGETLRQRIAAGPIDVALVVDLGIQIADALDAAHCKGIVHRDIKPANIFVTTRNQAKLLDFGLAKQMLKPLGGTALASAVTIDESLLTSPGSTVGTVAYMSPEQARGKDLDARTDLFSFGAVLYEMVTGALPFRGETTAVIFDAILNRPPASTVRLNPEVTPQLEEVISKLLEKDRELRYQSAAEVRADLKRAKRDTESGTVAAASSGKIRIAPPPAPPRPKRLWNYAVMAFAVVAIIGLAAVFFAQRHRASAMTERDAILVTDFVNTAADPVFDGTLKKALSVDLGQSPYLNVVSDQKVKQTLQYMGRSPDDRITTDVGREICQRDGIKAMLTGSIANLGSSYVITLEAINAATGESLAQAQSQAPNKEAVLNSLHEASSGLRRKLGESLASIQKFDKPLSEATTSSLEALKSFSLGDSNHFAGKELAALPLYQRAVELDPNFAMAYARLGSVYGGLGQTELAEQNRDKAFELRDRASEHEKLYITEHYYADAGQFDKGIAALELYKQTYPRDWLPYSNVASIYLTLGQFDNALMNAKMSVQLNPDSIAAYNNLTNAYLSLNRVDEAKATMEQAAKRNLTGIHGNLAFIAWLQNDPAAMEHELQLLGATPDGALNVLYFRQSVAAYHGQLDQFRDFGQKIRDANQRLSLPESNASEFAQEGAWEALFGQKARATDDVNQALKLSQAPTVRTLSAIVLALLGDESKALSLADQVAKQRPYDTMIQYVTVPNIKALVALNHQDLGKAADLLDGAIVYGRVDSAALYMRALTYLKAGQATEAVQAFQRPLDLKNALGTDSLLPLDQLGLARAYALEGDKPKARIAYQDFFATWKDASPEIPMLREARTEYARLQ